MSNLSDRLKELRKSKNLTQKELGTILGVGKTTISMYENGNSTPNDEIKLKIAEYFDVSLDYLLGKTDIKNYLNDPMNTIALHTDAELDYSDLTDEAKEEVKNFIDYIRVKYKKDK